MPRPRLRPAENTEAPTLTEVDVDEETGRITVPKVWCAHDCGRALNPRLVAGQIEGSVYMGIAEALLEEHKVNRFGLHSGPSLLDAVAGWACRKPWRSAETRTRCSSRSCVTRRCDALSGAVEEQGRPAW